jgi:demethoxyubiquinone hydroxylase (CLK1/Coq7/Cat5 family)
MLCRVGLVRTDVSEECSASIIRVTRIGELGTLAVISNQHMLQRATQSNNPEGGILYGHHHKNLKSYKGNFVCN